MSVTFSNTNLINLTTGNAPAIADPFYANVVLLLHCDGSDGSASFPDSGPLGKVPATVASPLSITNSSGRFNGSGNFTGGYIQYVDSADWDFGAGDFTMECFTNWNAASPGSRAAWMSQADTSGGLSPVGFLKTTSNTINFGGNMSDLTTWNCSSVNTISINTWYHIAGVRSGINFYLWVDGTLWASTTSNKTLINSASRLGVGIAGEYTSVGYGGTFGVRMMGLMDEVRITKGVARYTAPFTPPSAPFPNF